MLDEVTDEEATLVLVDANDTVIGSAAPDQIKVGDSDGKLLLHRTVSLYIFDSDSDSLLVTKSHETNLWTASVTATPLFGMSPAEVTVAATSSWNGNGATSAAANQSPSSSSSSSADIRGARNAVLRRVNEVVGGGGGATGALSGAAAASLKFVGRMYHADSAVMEYVFCCRTTATATTANTKEEDGVVVEQTAKWVPQTEWESFVSLGKSSSSSSNDNNAAVDAKLRAVTAQMLKLNDTSCAWKQRDFLVDESSSTDRIWKADVSSSLPQQQGDCSKKQGAYGKIVTHKESVFKQLMHVDEVWAAISYLYIAPLPSNLVIDSPDLAFCEEILTAVSRSFAAVIRQLPESILKDVAIFYLVLRALDTVEDDMTAFASNEIKCHHLLKFHTTALQDASWRMDGVGQGDERRLLQEFPAVHRVYASLPVSSQAIITDITHRMATGMAEFIGKDLGQGTADVSEYNRYCHFVAGLVGEGLSRLFAASGLEHDSLAAELDLSDQMGLFLQKTNIIRDFLEDYVDQRAFWPQSVWKKYSATGELGYFCNVETDAAVKKAALQCLNELVTDALELVPDCLAYMACLQCSEVFRFCAIPQVMAVATLEKCYNNPAVFTGVVKIRKGLSCKLIQRSSNLSELHETFYIFSQRMLARCKAETIRDENPALYTRTVAACEAALDLTRAKAVGQRRARAVRQWSAVVAIALIIAILWRNVSMPADLLRAALVVAVSILYWFGPWTVRSNLKTADLLKGRTVV